MSRISCKYHQSTPARWRCPACQLDLCPQCVKKDQAGPQNWRCFSCGGEVDSLGVGNTIPPFWERIPKFFIYPARVDALMYLGMLAIASVIIFVPLIGILLYLALSYAILKYAFLILNHTARGNLGPPQILSDNYREYKWLPFKQSVVFLLIALVVTGVAFVTPALAFIAVLFLMFAMPASTMSLAINRSIGDALNPLTLATVMKRIGWPYLILYVFLLLLAARSSATQLFLAAVAPGWLLIQLTTFVSAYFTVIMFHMMGYVVYQYHEELGFEDVREFAELDSVKRGSRTSASVVTSSLAAEPVDPFEVELNVLINEGKIDEAKQRMRRRMEGPAGTLADREKYHKLLQLARDATESSAHGLEYIRALIHTGDGTKAVQVYEDCVSLDSAFQIPDGRQSFRLAERAHAMSRNDTALRLLNRFAKRFANHELTADAFLLAAKLLCEHKGQDQQALTILDGLLRQFPGHKLSGEIEEYRAFVQRLDDKSLPRAS